MAKPIPTLHDNTGLQAWFGQSLDELDAHAASIPTDMRPHNPEVEIRAAIDGETAQVQIWWVNTGSRFASELLWDLANVDAPSGDNLLCIRSALSHHFRVGHIEHSRRVVRRRALSQTPLFHFHPLRFRALHPLGSFSDKAGNNSPAGGFTMEIVQGATERYVHAQHELMDKTRLRYMLQTSSRERSKSAELAAFVADYHHHGRQIFDFPNSLVEMFRRTDVDGIPLELINLPHHGQYLYFGPQKDLSLSSGWAPDGAYVSLIGGGEDTVIQFCLTFAPPHPEEYEACLENPEPFYIQGMPADRMKIGVGEAADLVLSDKVAELHQQIAKGLNLSAEELSDVQQVAQQLGIAVQDSTRQHAAAEFAKLGEMHKSWEGMLRLVVNGLAYLSAYRGDLQHKEATEVAPKDVVANIPAKPGKEYKRKSKLAELGYSALTVCGVNFGKTGASAHGDGEHSVDGNVFTWVRGHWRAQAHGPQWSLRRLQWTMPFRRRLQGGDEEAKAIGHIYSVDDVDNARPSEGRTNHDQ